MASYDKGKREAVNWIYGRFDPYNDTILDVGAGNGKWYDLLGEDFTMDALEAWYETIAINRLDQKYRMVYLGRIQDATLSTSVLPAYDFIIFGDVLEHMTVEEAQKVIAYAKEHCNQMLIAVPFLWEQGAIRGNPNEVHIQPDLTPELFNERYPGFKPIFMSEQYAYYVRDDV